MIDEDEVLGRVVEAIRTTFNVPPNIPIAADATSADVLGWDSLSHTMLIMKVEDEFGIELPLDELDGLGNVGALVALVQKTVG